MNETSKCHSKRLRDGTFNKYMVGKGIDIGCGNDPIHPPGATVLPWDWREGDAQYLATVADGSMDWIYSSHCLEHVNNVRTTLSNWSRVLRRGGTAYIVVPDYLLYEKLCWPSRFNSDHKHSFSLDYRHTRVHRNNHYGHNLMNMFFDEVGLDQFQAFTEDDGYDYNKGLDDQTLGFALAQITFTGVKL